MRWMERDRGDKIAVVLMGIYLFLVLCVTVIPRDFTLDPKWLYHESVPVTYVYWMPFRDLVAGYSDAGKQILLNVVMTMPFGFLYGMIRKKPSLFSAVRATFLLSLSIELFQLLTTVFLLYHRRCDVTDLITNVTGGALGYLLYRFYLYLQSQKQKS